MKIISSVIYYHHWFMVSVCPFELRIMGFNKFFYMGLLEIEHLAVTEKEAVWPLFTRGVWGYAPPEKYEI